MEDKRIDVHNIRDVAFVCLRLSAVLAVGAAGMTNNRAMYLFVNKYHI